MNTRTFCSLIASLSLLFGYSTTVQAGAPNDAWAYARDSIDAFYEIYATTTLHDNIPPKDGEFDFVKHMETTMAESRGFKKALAVLAPYSKSTDSWITFSYAALSGAMISLSASYDNSTDLLEKESNKSLEERMRNVGTFGRQIIEASQSNTEDWDFYVKMSATVSDVLSDESIADLMNKKSEDMNKPMSPYLRISSWQREDLKKHIVEKFGPRIATMSFGKLGKNQMPARLLLDFLNDKWKTHN